MKIITEKNCHNIQLKKVRLISLNSSINKDIEEYIDKGLKVETKVGNFSEVVNDKKGKAYLKTIVEGIQEDEPMFKIEVVYEGICESKKSVDKEELKFYLEIQSIPMLWSFARETINNIMVKMELKPVLLPTLNITDMINEIKSSKKGTGGEN